MLNSLRFKLIFFIFTSILVTLVTVGIAFDFLLSKQYKGNATSELTHSYEFINNTIKSFEKPILKLAKHLTSDDSIITSVNLLYRYQDRENYQPLIFDPEKKDMASHLLRHISATRSDVVEIFDHNGALILFAVQNERQNLTGFTSYQNGKPFYLVQDARGEEWLPSALPDRVSSKLPRAIGANPSLSQSNVIDYVSNENNISIESIQPIRRFHPDGQSELIGYARTAKSLDSTFFQTLSAKTNTNIALLLENGLVLNNQEQLLPLPDPKGTAQLMGSTMLGNSNWIEHSSHYIQHYVIPALNGKPYLFITIPKEELNSALNQSRFTLLIIFLITATIVIVFGTYWLTHLVSDPLGKIIQHASKFRKGESTNFPLSNSKDEIGHLSRVLNTMASAVIERERDLKSTQDSLNEAQHIAKIGSWNRNYRTGRIYWSDEIYNILNLDPASTTPYPEAFEEMAHPDDRELVHMSRIAAHRDQGNYDISYRILSDDNNLKFIHEYYEIEADDSGRVFSASGTIQDITEQHEKSETTRRTQKMDALGQLTGGIAHDFNNMLGVILGFSDLLLERVSDDTTLTKYTKNIQRAGNRAKDLTSKLLAFSHMKPLAAQTTDLNTLIVEFKHMLEKSLTARINLKFTLDEDLWPVSIEAGGFEDAILNMSINAMHAMPDGGTLTISTNNVHLSPSTSAALDIDINDYVLLSITDTGSGMNSETIEKIFDPFYSTKGINGTGLGMSQVYGFVKQSGGTIKVSSQIGHGSKFDIYLPRALSGKSNLVQAQEDVETAQYGGHETVLVVDDEEGIRNFESEMLTLQGYRTLKASCAGEALEILRKEPVDLLLSDIIMPGIDGYQLASDVSTHYPDIKIILASGYTDKSTNTSISEELRSHILKKPFTSATLLKQIRATLDSIDASIEENGNLSWSSQYETGIEIIDQEHKHLLSLFNSCRNALDNDDTHHIRTILNQLLDYVDYHFRHEEQLMSLCDYPDAISHKEVHQKLVQQLEEQIRRYGMGELTASSIHHFLSRWIFNHIVTMDKAIAPYCKGKEELIRQSMGRV